MTYSAHVLRWRPSAAISPFTSLRKSPCRPAPATTFLFGGRAKLPWPRVVGGRWSEVKEQIAALDHLCRG